MKSKRILRFYFNADKLEKTMNNLIDIVAETSYKNSGEGCLERLLALAEDKRQLATLWAHLDRTMAALPDVDRETLRIYCNLRCGISGMNDNLRKAIRRAVVKFYRRLAPNMWRIEGGLAVVDRYFCLM